MDQEVFSNNLLHQAETFLEGIYYWTWNDTLVSLKSCELFYTYADSYGVLEKIICALLAKIAQNPDVNLLTSSSSSSLSSPESNPAKRFSSSTQTTPKTIKSTLPSKAWWFKDLATLPPKIIEKFLQSIGAFKTDNNNLILTRFLLHYLKTVNPTGEVNCRNSIEYAGLAETAAYGVIFVGNKTFSCRGLFWVLRIVSGFGLSRDCRIEMEKLIGGMLEQATLDDLLVSGHHMGLYYDVNFVIRLVKLFVDIKGSDGVSVQKLKKIGRLIDKYLREISPDQNLKISKLLGVAECLPDSARDCFDGVYRAIDIYLEVLWLRLQSVFVESTVWSMANSQNLRLRHACAPHVLVEINYNLTTAQRARILTTPFRSLLNMPENLQISGVLLWELACRWDDQATGFRVRSRVVGFKPIDVCLVLGLRVRGERLQPDDGGECNTLSLLGSEVVTVDRIVQLLHAYQGDHQVDDFCRLYILLAFGVFYFPRTGRHVYGGFTQMLDDLDALGNYSWGVAVYDYLVDSLTIAASVVRRGENSCQRHIIGCAAILQVWALDHLSMWKMDNNPRVFPFPRFLNWQYVGISKAKINRAFRHNLIIEDVAATPEEMRVDILREALVDAQPESGHHGARFFDREDHASELRRLVAQNTQFAERISVLEQELSLLKEIVLQRPATAPSTSAAATDHPQNVHRQNDAFLTPIHGDSQGNEGGSQQRAGRFSPSTVGSPRLRSQTVARNFGESSVSLPQESDADEVDVEAVTTDKPSSNIATRAKHQPRKRLQSASTRTPFVYQLRNKKNTQK